MNLDSLKETIAGYLPDDQNRNKFIGLCVLVSMFLFMIFILPQIKTRKNLQIKINELNHQTENIQEMLTYEAKVNETIDELQGINKLAKDKVVLGINTNDIALHLTKAAVKNQIKLNNIRLSPETDSTELLKGTSLKLEVISFQLNLNTSLPSFYNFIEEINKVGCPFKLERVNLVATNVSPTINTNIDFFINFYMTRPEILNHE